MMKHISFAAVLLLECICAFAVAFASPVRQEGSDPLGTLLTAQALVEHRSFTLDTYPISQSLGQTAIINKHRYYIFPVGTPLYSAPAVALALRAGKDMGRYHNPEPVGLSTFVDDRELQNLLSALSVAAIVAASVMLARQFVGRGAALIIAGSFVFGSSMMSTLGTALWSANYTVLFLLLALIIVVRILHDQARSWEHYAAGWLLFSAYLCRPTALIGVVCLGALVLWQRPRAMIRGTTIFAVGMALFAGWSMNRMGSWQPPYYWSGRVGGSIIWDAVVGNAISPGRGLLVYSPFVATLFVALLVGWRTMLRQPLVWTCVVWFGLHYLAICRFRFWWGGWSYGSRLLVETMPLLLVLAALAWHMIAAWRPQTQRVWIAVLVPCVALAIWINTIQGMFNPWTMWWNVAPNIDTHPQLLFDWQYPPFLASEATQHQRIATYSP